MKRDLHTISEVISRSLRLRCPACGGASIVKTPYRIRQSCSLCGVSFNREEGFFVGAIMANVVATEVFIVVIYLASIILTNLHERVVLTILFVVGITFPLAFYHHAWSLWLAMDHLIEGLSRDEDGQYHSRKRMG